MKHGAVLLISLPAVLLGAALASTPAKGIRVEMHDPCSTFETGSRPVLRHGTAGLELLAQISVTKQAEAADIQRAASYGLFEIEIFPGREVVRATGLDDGSLVIEVSSATHAEMLAHKLCLGVPRTPA